MVVMGCLQRERIVVLISKSIGPELLRAVDRACAACFQAFFVECVTRIFGRLRKAGPLVS